MTFNSHYYKIIRANLANNILKFDKEGSLLYKSLKKYLQNLPVSHYDDKGFLVKTLKSPNDWYKCFIL